ncbi:MAG: hypothetical protein FWD99_00610 [Oscillospiraceae bacterium]|nr:hypothetical protein [Oscillospiraceae bacterium]
MDDFCSKKPTLPIGRGIFSLIPLMLAFVIGNLNIGLLIDGTHMRTFNRLASLVFVVAWLLFLYMSFKENGKKRLNFYLCFWLLNFVYYFALFFSSGRLGTLGDLLITLLFPLTVIFFIPMAGFGPAIWVYFSLCVLMFALGLIVKKKRSVKVGSAESL